MKKPRKISAALALHYRLMADRFPDLRKGYIGMLDDVVIYKPGEPLIK